MRVTTAMPEASSLTDSNAIWALLPAGWQREGRWRVCACLCQRGIGWLQQPAAWGRQPCHPQPGHSRHQQPARNKGRTYRRPAGPRWPGRPAARCRQTPPASCQAGER